MTELLFENLQTFAEASKLEERDNLSVSEYNKIKIAINKNNKMKANFILHPGKIEKHQNKLRLSIYGAFRSYEQTKQSYHAYNTDLKNDKATRDGVGAYLYYVYINLIDDSIKCSDVDYYNVRRYVNYYKEALIEDGIIKNDEMNIDTLIESIIEVAKQSQVDLENVLASKNFIYNLTGKRKVGYRDDKEYNLDLESVSLTEDFDPSMPNWLMRAIKLNNSSRGHGHKDINYTMPLDTMKWTVEPFPEKGKLANISDNEYIALLIDKSGDSHHGNYIVYFPAAYIGNDETIEINGRNRRIDSMSLRALAPYVKEYAHAIDSKNARASVLDIQKDRGAAKDGSIDKVTSNDRYMYGYADEIDKSGYIVDPNKYKRLLAQLKSDKYAERLEEVYIVLTDLKNKLKEYASNDELIPDAKDDRFKSRNISVEKLSRANGQYKDAIRYYAWATEQLDKISSGKKDFHGAEATESFTKYLADAEVHIVNCLNIIEPAQ